MILAPYALFVKHKMLFYQKKLQADRYAEMCVRNSGAVQAGHFPQEHLDTAAHSHHMRQLIQVICDRAFVPYPTAHSGHTRQSIQVTPDSPFRSHPTTHSCHTRQNARIIPKAVPLIFSRRTGSIVYYGKQECFDIQLYTG